MSCLYNTLAHSAPLCASHLLVPLPPRTGMRAHMPPALLARVLGAGVKEADSGRMAPSQAVALLEGAGEAGCGAHGPASTAALTLLMDSAGGLWWVGLVCECVRCWVGGTCVWVCDAACVGLRRGCLWSRLCLRFILLFTACVVSRPRSLSPLATHANTSTHSHVPSLLWLSPAINYRCRLHPNLHTSPDLLTLHSLIHTPLLLSTPSLASRLEPLKHPTLSHSSLCEQPPCVTSWM